MSTSLLRRKSQWVPKQTKALKGASASFKIRGVAVHSGFTMIEVLAVLLVLAVVMTVILSRTPSIERDAYAQAALLRSHLRFAQSLAMSDTTARWGVSLSPDVYTLIQNGLPSGIQLPSDSASTHHLPEGVRITSGIGDVVFDPWGSPGTASVTITVNTETISIAGVTGFIP